MSSRTAAYITGTPRSRNEPQPAVGASRPRARGGGLSRTALRLPRHRREHRRRLDRRLPRRIESWRWRRSAGRVGRGECSGRHAWAGSEGDRVACECQHDDAACDTERHDGQNDERALEAAEFQHENGKDAEDGHDNCGADAAEGFGARLRLATELAILNALGAGPLYGYDIVRRLGDVDSLVITEGTVYPILSRLRNEAYVESYIEESPEGPPRKYYRLTTSGRKQLTIETREWDRMQHAISRVMQLA